MKQNDIFRGQRDRSRIDINDPMDVQYVKHQFPWLSDEEIKAVIEKYGPDRDAVEAVLEQAGADKDHRR